MNYLSTEEEYFSYYLAELKDYGLVLDWNYETSKFQLSSDISFNSKVISKAKSIKADFTIKWSSESNPLIETCTINYQAISKRKKDVKVGAFYIYSKDCSNKDMSYVEIKSPFEKSVSSSYSFPYKQSWLLDTQDILIQKIIPRGENLFKSTFTPKKVQELEVYKVGVKKGTSKITWKVRSLEEYLSLVDSLYTKLN